MKLAVELARQTNGLQSALVTVQDDEHEDSGSWPPAPCATVQHRDTDDEPWVEAAAVPWQSRLTVHVADLKAHVRCVAPRWISGLPDAPRKTEGDPQD